MSPRCAASKMKIAGFRLFEDADDLLLGKPRFLHEGDSDRAVWPGILYPWLGYFHGATSPASAEVLARSRATDTGPE
jgi:hypothetical protein